MEDLRKNAINYGMYLGLILIAFNTIIYAADINLFTNMWVGILTMIIMVSVAVFTTVKHKNKLGGFLSFKEAFSSFIITVIVGSLISVIYTIVLFNFIDPENYRLVAFKDMSNEDVFITKSTADTKETIIHEGVEYPVVKMEISRTSHPFYTGKSKLIDTAGRIDKFKTKYAKHAK